MAVDTLIKGSIQLRLSHCRKVIDDLRSRCPRGASLPMGYYFTDTPEKKFYRGYDTPGCYWCVEDSETELLEFYERLQPRWWRKGFLEKCEPLLKRFERDARRMMPQVTTALPNLDADPKLIKEVYE